jgi:nitrite reductase (NADH) small subunit
MWHSVAKKSDLPKNSSLSVEIEGHLVALFCSGGKYYAMEGRCVHRGAPLGDGHLSGSRVTCPWHAWEFNVKSGECYTMAGAKQQMFPVKVEQDEIWVDL